MSGPDRPRVHWVSPLPPAETDIAHYSARILPELAEAVDLTLWTDAPRWDRALEVHCPVRHLDPHEVLPRDFAVAGQGGNDVLFINIGNSWVFHSGIMELARRLPSVIVLHDMAIQEMLFDSILNRRADPGVYTDGMARWYGPEGAALARRLLDHQIGAQEVGRQAPGFELSLDRAISVLTHTRVAFDAVTARQALPAYLLDLPFAPAATPPDTTRNQSGPLRFAQFGYIGPNRRLEPVLEVLAGLKNEIDFRFDVMGKVWDPSHIQGRVDALGLTDRVIQHGFVPEQKLDACLAEAHLIFNLRYPTMGEASGSQLRIWNAGAASVVTDLGFYATLPDETVFKIEPDEEGRGLADLIRRLNADRSLGEGVARAGWERLLDRHTPARYAQGIAEVAHRAQIDAAESVQARSARRVLSGLARAKDTGALAESGLLLRRLAEQL